MTVDNPKNLVPKFFDNTSTSYDKVAVLATFGKDRYWKKEILKHIQKGTNILDLACGTGILTRKLAEKFPNSKIIGLDITQSYLQIAKRNSFKYTNISFIHQDAEKLNLDKKFDCIVSSYIPKYCKPELLVQRCLLNPSRDGVVEETPQAYKDVDAVVNVSHELGIATKVAKLVPIGVIKG